MKTKFKILLVALALMFTSLSSCEKQEYVEPEKIAPHGEVCGIIIHRSMDTIAVPTDYRIVVYYFYSEFADEFYYDNFYKGYSITESEWSSEDFRIKDSYCTEY